jgi:type I restriction enzyme M protein
LEHDELLKRDKLSLKLFWIKDRSLADTDGLPAPEIIAAEIADDPRVKIHDIVMEGIEAGRTW